MYNIFLYNGFNLIYTSVPIIWFACMDFEYEKKVLLNMPALYKGGLYNIHFNLQTFLMWIFKATLTSVIIMTMTENDYLDAPRQDGKISGYASFGDFVYTCIVLTVNIKILVSSKSIDSGIVLTTILSIICGAPSPLTHSKLLQV